MTTGTEQGPTLETLKQKLVDAKARLLRLETSAKLTTRVERESALHEVERLKRIVKALEN